MAPSKPSEVLRRNILWYSTFWNILSCVFIAALAIWPLYTHLKIDAENKLTLLLNSKTAAVEGFIKRAQAVASQIASRSMIAEALETYNQGGISIEALTAYTVPKLEDPMGRSRDIAGICRLDAGGRVVVQVGLPIDPALLPFSGNASREVIVRGPFKGGNADLLYVSAPIFNRREERIGTDVVLFKLAGLSRILEGRHGLGTTGAVLLGAKTAEEIKWIRAPAGPASGRQDWVPDAWLTAILERTLRKETGVEEPGGWKDRSGIVAYGPIGGLPWGLVIREDREEVYGPMIRRVLFICGWTLAVIGLGSLGMILCLRPLMGRMILHSDELAETVREKTTALEAELAERRKTEACLRASERRLSLAIGATSDAIWEWHLKTGETYFSPRWYEMLGYPDRAFPMSIETWQALCHPEDVEPTAELILGTLSQPDATGYQAEFRMRRQDGTMAWILGRGNVVERDGEGGPVILSGTNTDITERKTAEEALQNAHDELEMRVAERTRELARSNQSLRDYATRLERLNQELEEFTWIATHDLQEPLRKIQIFGSRLKEIEASLSQERQADLVRIIQCAGRMGSLVKSLKTYSNVTRGEGAFELVDLAGIVAEAAGDLEIALAETGGRIETAADLPSIEVDRVKMRQLFQNLIGNALKYAGEAEKPVVRISGRVTDGMCCIRVEDNGIGFDEQYLDRIFRPFQRLHGQGSPYAGTGMGLAICRKVVELHGGAITAQSALGKGTAFIITLPARQRKESEKGGKINPHPT